MSKLSKTRRCPHCRRQCRAWQSQDISAILLAHLGSRQFYQIRTSDAFSFPFALNLFCLLMTSDQALCVLGSSQLAMKDSDKYSADLTVAVVYIPLPCQQQQPVSSTYFDQFTLRYSID